MIEGEIGEIISIEQQQLEGEGSFETPPPATPPPATPAASAINGWVADVSQPCFGLPGAIMPTGYFDPLGEAGPGSIWGVYNSACFTTLPCSATLLLLSAPSLSATALC